MQDKVDGAVQMAAGATLLSLKYWSPVLDRLVSGAHAVAAICGAILGLYGVWKLAFGRRRKGIR